LKKIDQAAGSIRALRTHLEYVNPGKKSAVAPMKDPQRDVEAAILSDVLDLSSLEIEKELGFSTPKNADIKRENRTAVVAANHGRLLLRHYFGVEGWEKRVERMREARVRWLSLDEQPKKQIYYLLAERRGTSIAEEEHEASQDGFDRLLDEWAAAVERNDCSAAKHISTLDYRFTQALRQY
jgi:hypothetical protein